MPLPRRYNRLKYSIHKKCGFLIKISTFFLFRDYLLINNNNNNKKINIMVQFLIYILLLVLIFYITDTLYKYGYFKISFEIDLKGKKEKNNDKQIEEKKDGDSI